MLITGQFNDSFPPIMDGVANAVCNYAYWLREKEGAAYVVTPACPGSRDQYKFKVLRYFSLPLVVRPAYRLGIPALDRTFLKSLEAVPFRLVHAHCPFSAGSLALETARKRGIPCVASFHTKYYDDFKEALKSAAAARLLTEYVVKFYTAADAVWAVNDSSAETLRGYGFKGKIDVIGNGADLEPLPGREQAAAVVRERLGFSREELVFLYTGQLVPQKNVRLILEALRMVKNRGLAFRMIFAGAGPAERELKGMTARMGLAGEVVFLGLVRDREYLKHLFCRADLFLFPSVYDNAPVAVKEAAAAGCPALLIKGSNAAEGVEDGYNGFLAENSAPGVAGKILEAVSERGKLASIGGAARETLYTSWERIVDEVRGRYREIIRAYKFRRTEKPNGGSYD
ncbi:MAG: glycosyltransferase [Bacillota bacterium]